MDFKGKTAVVSGAASGMGLCFCETFAKLGGNSVMADINEEAVKEKAKAITDNGGSALAVRCDVRKYEDVTAACKAAYDTFGSVDIVINFAGGYSCRIFNCNASDFPDVPIDVLDWGIDVNLRAQMYFDHAAMKYMREQNSGLIVNIGSVSGLDGSPVGLDYCTSKIGVMEGLTKSVAQSGAKHGIRCVCVSPGPVLTRPGMAGMKTLLGRAAEPKEVIDLILFIASDKGQFINGTNIMIDGGRSAMERPY